MKLPGYVLLSPSGAFELKEGDDGSRVYRKEVVYPGHFVKKDSKGNIEFELPVTDELMKHWVATFKKMKAAGVEVPVPIEHTSDPEQRRGTVVDMAVEPSEVRKGDALFAYIQFRDEETGDALSKTAQVSLYSPPDFVDGRGNRYIQPIRHVALTDYPLIPGLDKFEAVAASFVLSEASSMRLCELADRLGVAYEASFTDEEIAQAIEEAWTCEDMMGVTTTEGDLDMEDDFVPTTTMMDDLGDDDLGMEDDFIPTTTEGDLGMSSRRTARPQRIAASIVNQIAESRKTKLTQLQRDRKITPAVRKALEKQYCGSKQVSYALSHEASEGKGDDFDAVVKALSLNKPVFALGEKTGPQTRGEGDDQPLLSDAERRDKEARRQRARR